MPIPGEIDPAQKTVGLATGVALATAASIAFPGNALAQENRADVDAAAFNALKNAPARGIDSFPAPASSSETLVPGPRGLVSAEASQATASDQLQDCVDAALAKPLKMWSTMYFPGDSQDERQQSTDGYLRFKPTSATCAPLVSRGTPTARMKMQRPNNHKKFIRSKKKELIGNEDGVEGPMDANGGRLGYASFGRHSGDGNKLLYRCTPGKGVTKAWMTFTVRVANPEDGSTLGKRSFTQSIKISRTSPDLVTDNGVAGPC